MTTDTPTPRTDNTDHWRVDRDVADLTYVDVVSADFARELERELAECRAALRELLSLHYGQLQCRADESDRECLNRVTQETTNAARDILAKGEGK